MPATRVVSCCSAECCRGPLCLGVALLLACLVAVQVQSLASGLYAKYFSADGSPRCTAAQRLPLLMQLSAAAASMLLLLKAPPQSRCCRRQHTHSQGYRRQCRAHTPTIRDPSCAGIRSNRAYAKEKCGSQLPTRSPRARPINTLNYSAQGRRNSHHSLIDLNIKIASQMLCMHAS